MAALGEYVTFLDSDDEFLPEKLKKQIDTFKSDNRTNPKLGAVFTGAVIFDDALGRTVGQRGMMAQSILVRKECFEHVGLYDEDLPASTQWDMQLRLASKFEFGFDETPLCVIHQHDGARVWNPDNRSKALSILIGKHRDYFARHRGLGAGLAMAIGAEYLRQGRKTEARREFFRSIRLYPYWPTGHIYLLQSFLGTRVFFATQAVKERITRVYRSWLGGLG
jgi:glycosyltransferase involved in cell wall biosynthesis